MKMVIAIKLFILISYCITLGLTQQHQKTTQHHNATSQLCPSTDSCEETPIVESSPCGSPCGTCVAMIINGTLECRQCAKDHYYNKQIHDCASCEGSFTNNDPNYLFSCRDEIRKDNDATDQTATAQVNTPSRSPTPVNSPVPGSTTEESIQTTTDAKNVPDQNIYIKSTVPITTHRPKPTVMTRVEKETADPGAQNETTSPDPAKKGGLGAAAIILIVLGFLIIFSFVGICIRCRRKICNLQLRRYPKKKQRPGSEDEIEMTNQSSSQPETTSESLLPPNVIPGISG